MINNKLNYTKKEIAISMKTVFTTKLLFVIVLILTISFNSQSQTSLIWARQLGTDKEEYVHSHVVDKDGNIYISGNTQGIMNEKNFGKTDGFITKIDSSGTTKWSRQFGTVEDEDIQWSAIDSKGNIYITGFTSGILNSMNHGKEDIFVIKYSPDGEKIWTKQIGSDSTDQAFNIYIDKKDFIYITGSTSGKLGESTFGSQDAFIIKLDSKGNTIFTHQFGTSDRDGCAAVTGDNNGNIYVCGSTFSNLDGVNKGFMDGFMGKFTDKGELIKISQFGTDGFDIATSILVDNDNNVYVGGTTSGNFAAQQQGEGDCFLTKFSNKGNIVWSNQFGTEKHDGIKGLAFNPKSSENILVSGLLNLPPAHAFIRMYKKDGSLAWERNLIPDGETKDASGKDISIDTNGNIYQVGLTASNLFGALIGVTDFYVIKLRLDTPGISK